MITYTANVASTATNGSIFQNVAYAASLSSVKSDTAIVRVHAPQAPASWSCLFIWDPPIAGTNKGDRKIGQNSNVLMDVRGPANSPFTIVNQLISSPSVQFTSNHSTNSSGIFNVKDTTPIPANYPAGDYNTSIQVNGQTVASCSGFVISSTQIVTTNTFDLSIQKRVQNVSDFTGFASSVNADPGERVRFEIVVTAGGNATQNNVVLRDVIWFGHESRFNVARQYAHDCF